MMHAFNNSPSGKPRSFVTQPLYVAAALALIIVVVLIGWSTFVPHEQSAFSRPGPSESLAPPIVPPIPLYRPAIVGVVDDAQKACDDWKFGTATLGLSHQDAAAALAMCEALTPGSRTRVRAGDTAISLDFPSVILGFVLALFAWGVLIGLGSMFRSAFRRAPAPQPWSSVERFESEWGRGG